MEAPQTKTPPGADIAEQTYQGPGATVTSLGYGFIDFKLATAASLILGIGASYLAPQGTAAALKGMERAAARWKQGNPLQKAVGHTLHLWNLSGNWFTQHIPFANSLKPHVKSWDNVARATGMLGTLSFIATTFSGTKRGIDEARAGRDQFNAAKAQIKDLRAENAALRERYANVKLDAELAPAAPAPAEPSTTVSDIVPTGERIAQPQATAERA